MGKVRQRVTHVQHFRLQGLLAREGEKLAHQCGGTVGVFVDLDQITEILIALIVPEKQEVTMA